MAAHRFHTARIQTEALPSVPDHFETGLLRVLKHWYWANN